MTTTTTITTTSRRLGLLLAPVLPFADRGDTLPLLRNVLLRGHGEHGITATTTDRYRLGVSRDEGIAAPEGFRALVPEHSLRHILTVFRATKDHDPEIVLAFDERTVTVSTPSLGFDLDAAASMTFRLFEESGYSKFPNIDGILLEAFAGPVKGADDAPVALSAKFLADYQRITRDGYPVVFRPGKPGRPVGVEIGDYFRGAIMPVRVAHDGDAPVGLNATWSALLDPPAKTPAKVEPKRRAVKAAAVAAAGAGA